MFLVPHVIIIKWCKINQSSQDIYTDNSEHLLLLGPVLFRWQFLDQFKDFNVILILYESFYGVNALVFSLFTRDLALIIYSGE